LYCDVRLVEFALELGRSCMVEYIRFTTLDDWRTLARVPLISQYIFHITSQRGDNPLL
jgi:hypothetical protein